MNDDYEDVFGKWLLRSLVVIFCLGLLGVLFAPREKPVVYQFEIGQIVYPVLCPEKKLMVIGQNKWGNIYTVRSYEDPALLEQRGAFLSSADAKETHFATWVLNDYELLECGVGLKD